MKLVLDYGPGTARRAIKESTGDDCDTQVSSHLGYIICTTFSGSVIYTTTEQLFAGTSRPYCLWYAPRFIVRLF